MLHQLRGRISCRTSTSHSPYLASSSTLSYISSHSKSSPVIVYKSPNHVQLSDHTDVDPFLVCHNIWCSIKPCGCNIFFHTLGTSFSNFHITKLGFLDLQYLFFMYSLQRVCPVLKFHHNLQNKALNTLCISLNPNSSSSFGRQRLLHVLYYLPLPSMQLFQIKLGHHFLHLFQYISRTVYD